MKKTKVLDSKTAEKLKKIEDNNRLRLQLTSGPDLLIEKKKSDTSLDFRIEKIELINGRVINIKELRAYIDGKIHDYGIKFHQEFYREIFRLNSWALPVSGIIKEKPNIVAEWTNLYIYGRFPKEVLPEIQGNNDYNAIGIRLYRHFQFLTEEGIVKLENFILEAIQIMKRCTTWDEFVKEHAIAYGFPFQTSLFN